MEEDLGLNKNKYQTAVSLLFVTYVLCETPSNLVIKKLRPSRWIAGITVGWGIVATLTGLVQSYGGLIAVRLILGALEAGLFPGMTIYLTLFYTKRELALRVGYLFVSAAIAGSVGGLLAYAIGHMDGVAGQRGWRWIMIIEVYQSHNVDTRPAKHHRVCLLSYSALSSTFGLLTSLRLRTTCRRRRRT